MTYKEARALAVAITARAGYQCTASRIRVDVPDGYAARIWTARNDDGTRSWEGPARPRDFTSLEGWAAWYARAQEVDAREEARHRALARPRSAIERMIDQACGLE